MFENIQNKSHPKCVWIFKIKTKCNKKHVHRNKAILVQNLKKCDKQVAAYQLSQNKN